MRANLFFQLLLIPCSVGYAQTITTSAGDSTWKNPIEVAVDSQGNQYVASFGNYVIFKVDRLGASTIVAGTMDSSGFGSDGGLATNTKLGRPQGIAVDQVGAVYIADTDYNRIRKVGTDGIITTIAGFSGSFSAGFSGDHGPATGAKLSSPTGLVFDGSGNLYIADTTNGRIRKIDTNGTITTFAGNGDLTTSGDGGPALLAGMRPGDLAFGQDGSLFFNDNGSSGGRVRRVDPSGMISAFAGTGARNYSGDGGPATAATFYSVDGLAMDRGGNLFVSDATVNRVRKIAPNGIITTYAGTGVAALSGDGGPAINARLSGPSGLALDASNNLYLADFYNARIRKISSPALPTIAATNSGQPSFLGKAGFSSNTYLEIYGMNLAQTNRTWGGSDFHGQNAPTSLDGVSVTIDGKSAFVYYISPTQINVNTPEDSATGPVQVVVTNSMGTSNVGSITRARLSPTLQSVAQFAIGGTQYVVAQTPDFKSFIGRPNMIAGVPFVAAKPGDTISLYALGCGPTNPVTQAGVITTQAAPLALAYQISIGGIAAQVTFGGMVANSIGLYQLNVIVPNVPAGDQPISLTVDGVINAQNLSIVIGS